MRIPEKAQEIIEKYDAARFFLRRGVFDLTAIRSAEMRERGEGDKHAFFDAFFGGYAVSEGNVEVVSPLMAAARAYSAEVAAERERKLQEIAYQEIVDKLASGYRWETNKEVAERLAEAAADPEGAFGGRGSNSPLADPAKRLVKKEKGG